MALEQGEVKREQSEANGKTGQRASSVAATTAQPVKQVESPRLERPCREGESDTNCDLRAQWKAANAAEEAADWAARTFWTTVLGTLGLFLTLYYTRQAVRVAQDATKDSETALAIADRNADAVVDQVTVARDAANRHLRPYVYIESARLAEIAGNLMVEVVFKNFGLSPAYNLILEVGGGFFDYPLTSLPVLTGNYPSPGVLAPTHKAFSGSEMGREQGVAGLRGIRAGSEALLLHVRASYDAPNGRDFDRQILIISRSELDSAIPRLQTQSAG